MKIIFLLLFFLSSLSPAMALEACEIDNLKFCEQQDSRIPKMCPEVLDKGLEKKCVVTSVQAKVIRKECARELKEICRVSKGEDFLSQYICLTNPEKWEKFKPACLKSLVKDSSHH